METGKRALRAEPVPPAWAAHWPEDMPEFIQENVKPDSVLNVQFRTPEDRRAFPCILIQNDIPFRWRGRYNEDTDLSLRALKALC